MPVEFPGKVWLNKKAVSRLGYGAVLALLVFSSAETYRIHDRLSVRHAGIFRQYMKQDDALRSLRRNVFLVSTNVRDFFLSTGVERAAILEADLRKAKADWQASMGRLDLSRAPSDSVRALHEDLTQFFEVVTPISRTMINATDSQEYEFVQREITPRRTRIYTELLDMTESEQQLLQKSEQDFEFTQQAALRRLLRTLGLCVVLGGLLSLFSLRYAERLEAETVRQFETVAHAKGELERLSARLVQVEEEGRRSLSRELHDEIGQTLTAVRIEIAQALKRAENQAVKAGLIRARALTERSVQTVRNICLLLRPALLDELGLIPALEWQSQEFAQRSGIACEFSESGSQFPLPDSVKTCVYRVLQEALNNCEKHAAASHIRIAVRYDSGVLSVEVADDGRGFALNDKGMPASGRGLGVLGMRERAVMVDGDLRIESAPGHGTLLAVRIPVSPEATPHPSRRLDGVNV